MKTTKTFQISMLALCAVLVQASPAMAYDDFKCSGKDCLDKPATSMVEVTDQGVIQILNSTDGEAVYQIDSSGQIQMVEPKANSEISL